MKRKVFFTLVAIFILISSFVYSEEEWYLEKPIKDFRFKGLVTVSVNELRPIVRPYIGRKFTLDLFWEVQEKLYALDYFESIESNALPGDNDRKSVIVEFVVKEHPVVSSIEIQGAHRVRNGEILDKIVIKKGDMITDAKLKSDEEVVRNFYLEKGFTDVRVDVSIERNEKDKDANEAKVVFKIVEGEQTTIKEVNFVGNSYASTSTLRGIMKTKAQSLFNSGVFQESKLQKDIKAIEDYYADHGYVDAKVERVERKIEETEKEGKKYLYLTLYIKEGEQYKYGGMSFEGNKIFSTEKLKSLVRQKPGGILSKKKLNADYQRITDLYYENGYIFNAINLEEKRNKATKTIYYTVKIVERDRAHIESISFKGNKKTKDFVLYRELPFEVGDIFNKKKIIEGLRNLYNLQYFSSVTPDTNPGSAEGLMDIVINLEEASTADINMGITFSGTDFPVSGLLKWSEKNFRGMGETISASLQASPLKQSLSFNFVEPWMFGVRWLGGINFALTHAQMENIPQDILPPIFSASEYDSGIAVPDPYDGHYVFTKDTEYPPGSGITYSAGDAFPGVPTSEDIVSYSLKTDYQYAVQTGKTIPTQYEMKYNSYDITFGLNTGYKFHSFLGWLGTGLGISTRFRTLSYDANEYRPYDPKIRANLNRWSIINKLNTDFYWDKRDYILNPTNGFFVDQRFTYTGGMLGGDRQYIKTVSRIDGFLTFFDIPVFEEWNFKMVGAAHSALSLILPQLDGKLITDFTDLLYIDGMNVGRGWASGTTPLSYGRVLWDNRTELRIPVAEQFLWGVLFTDVAGIWETPEDFSAMSINDLLFSFGFGFRFTIPQFPIRLYLSKGFQIKDNEIEWKNGSLNIGGLTLDFVISLGGDNF